MFSQCKHCRHQFTCCILNSSMQKIDKSTVVAGIYWFIYEMCKSRWLRHTGNDTLHFLEAFSSGALAGSVSCIHIG